jgi:hypothetical protein
MPCSMRPTHLLQQLGRGLGVGQRRAALQRHHARLRGRYEVVQVPNLDCARELRHGGRPAPPWRGAQRGQRQGARCTAASSARALPEPLRALVGGLSIFSIPPASRAQLRVRGVAIQGRKGCCESRDCVKRGVAGCKWYLKILRHDSWRGEERGRRGGRSALGGRRSSAAAPVCRPAASHWPGLPKARAPSLPREGDAAADRRTHPLHHKRAATAHYTVNSAAP